MHGPGQYKRREWGSLYECFQVFRLLQTSKSLVDFGSDILDLRLATVHQNSTVAALASPVFVRTYLANGWIKRLKLRSTQLSVLAVLSCIELGDARAEAVDCPR